MQPHVDLNLARIFLSVYRCGSVTGAMKILCLSQPAISNALKRLNQILNCQLFVRSGRQIQATAEAHELYQKLSLPLEELTQAFASFNQFDATQTTRHFKVSLSGYFDHFLPSICNAFEHQAPHAQIIRESYNMKENIKRLDQGGLDLMLCAINRVPKHLITMDLDKDNLVLVSKKQHALLLGQNNPSLKLIKKLRFISLIKEYEESIPAYHILSKLNVSVYVRITAFSNMLEIVKNSDSVALMPTIIAKHYDTVIDYYPLPLTTQDISLKLVWAKHNNNNLAHQWLRSLISQLYIGASDTAQ